MCNKYDQSIPQSTTLMDILFEHKEEHTLVVWTD